ncbi:MAG: PAS domain S-box protein [Burkholderiaceae bacterium]|nr:PAS domain S-box protein [Burkholderiaceae bacterium]
MHAPKTVAPFPAERPRGFAPGAAPFPFELVLENTVVGISYMSQRRFVWANARMAQIFGYEPGELDGEPVRRLYSSQEDYDEVGRMYADFARFNGVTHEHAMTRKNGESIWCLISGRMIDPSDASSASVWVVQDITDRKRAEDQLRRTNQRLEQTVERRTRNLRRTNEALAAEVERRRAAQLASAQSREKYRALFRHMPVGVLVAESDGRVAEVNRALLTYLGVGARTRLDTIIEDASRVVAPDGAVVSLARLVREQAKAAVRRVNRFEIGWLAPSGKRREILVVAAPLSGRSGGTVFAFADVTEQRVAREREHAQQSALAHASRLTLMGQMASTLAHELGQPLNACQSYLAGIRHRLHSGTHDREAFASALEKASAHLDQAGDIIRNVRGFVGRQGTSFEPVDLPALIEQTLTLLELSLRAGQVQVVVELPSGESASLPPVRGRPVEIQQVLVNLLINAIEAMQAVRPAERRIEIRLANELPSAVAVEIRDRGPGVPESIASSVFDPYYTTKESGLGMGLMISRTIVESHGGSLRLFTLPDRGACFRFTLRTARRSA